MSVRARVHAGRPNVLQSSGLTKFSCSSSPACIHFKSKSHSNVCACPKFGNFSGSRLTFFLVSNPNPKIDYNIGCYPIELLPILNCKFLPRDFTLQFAAGD